MNATPPEARLEYSRAGEASSGDSGGRGRGAGNLLSAIGSGVPGAVLGGGFLGAVLLIIAEFTTLYDVRKETSSVAIKTIASGSNHSYALIPIALLAVVLAYGAWRYGSRPALLAIGALGVVALLIALVGDLPDAHASGTVGSPATGWVPAHARPSTGLYMETLGAAVLVMTCGLGLLLGGSAPRSVD